MVGSSHPPGSERRRYERHSLWFPVTLELAEREVWSICRDVSRTGLLVSARQPVPVGTKVTARFKIVVSQPEEWVLEAKVVRCEENASELALAFPSRIAIEFDEPTPPMGDLVTRAEPSH
jgi:hypothetical protein